MLIISYAAGAIGHLASAATVAASSFDMKVMDPQSFIDSIDLERWNSLRRGQIVAPSKIEGLAYVEPSGSGDAEDKEHNTVGNEAAAGNNDSISSDKDIITGKVQRLEDFIDTDAVSRNFSQVCVPH